MAFFKAHVLIFYDLIFAPGFFPLILPFPVLPVTITPFDLKSMSTFHMNTLHSLHIDRRTVKEGTNKEDVAYILL